jgi:hypothetical protein
MEAMAGDSTLDDPDDARRLAMFAEQLVDGIESALPGWVARAVEARAAAAGIDVADREVRSAGDRAVAEVVPAVRALLAADIDEQRTNPLHLLREAVRYPTEVLAAAGVPPVGRDPDAARLFPDDAYDLTPGSFADVDPALHEPGLHWGAAKAHVHLARRRSAGQR